MDLRLCLIFTTFCLSTTVFGQCDRCPNGWTRYEQSCYKVGYEQSFTFVEAEHYCRQHNGYLVHVDNAEENRFIVDILHTTQAGDCWLGLSDMDIEGTWQWYDTQTSPGYTNWYPTEPNGGNVEDCAAFIKNQNYDWEDYTCSKLFHPVCEMTPQNTEIIG